MSAPSSSKASWDKVSAILDPVHQAIAEDEADGLLLSHAPREQFLAWNETSRKLHTAILEHIKSHPDALMRAAPRNWIKASRLLANAAGMGSLLRETAPSALLPQPEANDILVQVDGS